MNKLDLHPSPLAHPADHRADGSFFQHISLEQEQRLLVLIPAEVDYITMTKEIWELAIATGAQIQLLGLCREAVEEPMLCRGLAVMSALIQEAGVLAEAKVEIGTNWVDLIKRNHQKRDLVVCFAEQRVGLLQRPLSQILQSNLNVQVYILSGLKLQEPPPPNWLSHMMAWAGSLGIIGGSFLLQIRITLMPQDWAQTTLLIFSVLGEISLIWIWNNLFS